MSLECDLTNELKRRGADFVYFVDVSHLAEVQNKGYAHAILLGIALSREYLQKVACTTEYVKNMVLNDEVEEDEFHLMEIKADDLADLMAEYLIGKGYSAYSQSENNILKTGYFNEEEHRTPLPHKTIAGLAGLGWIGKHNLLVTPEYGSAICMCSVLTDAPLETILKKPLDSLCGDCTVCKDVCQVNAIKGNLWDYDVERDEIVDVYKCTTCLACMVFCPWTVLYTRSCENAKV